MAQQTALQFFLMGLVDLEIGKGIPTDKEVELRKLFEQAKQMQEEQIIDAYKHGQNNEFSHLMVGKLLITGEEYYNQTFKK